MMLIKKKWTKKLGSEEFKLARAGAVGKVDDNAASKPGFHGKCRHHLHLFGSLWVELEHGTSPLRLSIIKKNGLLNYVTVFCVCM